MAEDAPVVAAYYAEQAAPPVVKEASVLVGHAAFD